MSKPVLAVTCVLSIGAPVGAALYVEKRTSELSDRLTEAAELPAKVGGVDADLTGTVRLTDVSIGDLLSVDAVEGATSLESLLDGQVGVDEVRVDSPRVSIAIDANGDSDLARLARRMQARRGGGGGEGGAARQRRVIVSGGHVHASIAGVGTLEADDVELVPDDSGVRVITGPVRASASHGDTQVELAFTRGAAEVALPHFKIGRMLAVGGTGAATLADRTVPLRDVAAGRLAANGAVELHASLDDGGVPRHVAAEVVPGGATLRGDRVPLRALGALAPHGLDLDGARGSGTLIVRRTATGVHVDVDGAVDGARFDHPSIAPGPIPLDATLVGGLDITADAVTLGESQLTVGSSKWTMSGWLRRGQPVSAQLDVRLAPAACNDLLASLPVALRGPLDGMAMTGTFGGHAKLAIDLSAAVGDGAQLETQFDGACRVDSEPPAADVASLAGITEHAYPDGTSGKVGRGAPGWIELARLPGYLPMAFVAAEDAAFFDHHGFDLGQIARSLEIDLRERRLARGGSTISQQLVKNVFLSQRRSADRKLQEAILTWRLEERMDKKSILERYLNVIELGPRVFGIGAASKHWFGVPPYMLNLHQAAFLAAMTSEPTSMSRRVRRAGGIDQQTSDRVDVVLRAMQIDGFIDSDTMLGARNQPMGFVATALKQD